MSACQGISLNPASDQLCRSGVSPPEGGSIAALRLLVWRAKIFFLKTGFCGIIRVYQVEFYISRYYTEQQHRFSGRCSFFSKKGENTKTVDEILQRKENRRDLFSDFRKQISGRA